MIRRIQQYARDRPVVPVMGYNNFLDIDDPEVLLQFPPWRITERERFTVAESGAGGTHSSH